MPTLPGSLRLWLFATFVAVSSVAFAPTEVAAQESFAEGKAWSRLAEPQPTESGNKVEVVEFFSYGCIHCYHLEEHIGAWAAKLPADVNFIRVPVFSLPLARVYYTLEALGRGDLTPKVFKSIHDARVPLHDEKTFFGWASSNGIDETKLKDAWNSFTVNGKVNRTKTLAQNYRINATPTVVVDGKFILQYGPGRVDFNQTSQALAFLVAKARSERK